MIHPDVNVLVYAHREDAVDHTRYRQWLEEILQSGEPYGISDHVLSGFLRVVTHPRVFTPPSPIGSALDFVGQIREQPNCRLVAPGPRHWQIFTGLCHSLSAAGNLVPDVWFAALAIESDCEWITTDRAYERFPGLRWRHPLSGKASG
ncbi:MAG: type II toxin-antitoxin system VapC family toxin [Verrucomicrobiota bacterium]|jgi:toxin-antitoxin system PIN domain toxin